MEISHIGNKIVFKMDEKELDELEQVVARYKKRGFNQEDALHKALEKVSLKAKGE